MTYVCNVPCARCENTIHLSEDEWRALCEEHNLNPPQALVIGNLCGDCRAGYLDWLKKPRQLRGKQPT